MSLMPDAEALPRQLDLADRFAAVNGPILLTGVQAVCRVPLDMRRVDARKDLTTRAFVSGYQGSPLGTLDFTMRPISGLLSEHGVDFTPGMNEFLAATAVQGTQSVGQLGSPYAGVTAYWYGKAPGVDQALDAIRHGNLMGTSANGGVLAFCGDDATAKSSTVPCGSETVLRSALVPTLMPADAQEVLRWGLHGVSMSRASGVWVAMKVATHVADSLALVEADTDGFDPIFPLVDGRRYEHEVMTKPVAAAAVAAERNLLEVRLPLALEYARLNGLNQIVASGPDDVLGIVVAGQPYLEVRQALSDMGFCDDGDVAAAGIRILKIGMVWPLDEQIVQQFAHGLTKVLVVEDKGPFLETLVKEALYGLENRPGVVGKTDEQGRTLLPSHGGVDADAITKVLAPMILASRDITSVRDRVRRLATPSTLRLPLTIASRTPYFCSGCPHNSSTKAPEGSLMGAGIGCHGMTTFMDSGQVGDVTGLTQMGGEGAQWIGQQAYVHADHIFQNLGDGTLSHSGLMAIRASIAARTNITYKVLYNSTVAMTGGQDAVGEYTVPTLARTLVSEGVERICITTDHPENYKGVRLPDRTTVHDRSELLSLQEKLRAIPGTTALIHDQPCAAELRRDRKRGKAPQPAMRVVINERICEGCGDCGRKSNCLSVVPVDTEFGRKTQIHQASCNSDFTCMTGDCPSFMEIIPDGAYAGPQRLVAAPLSRDVLPDPAGSTVAPDEFNIRITGIGGTGIVTVAQTLAVAGYMDRLTPRSLDQVGLSQKAGPVVSDVKFTRATRSLSPKVSAATCDLYLGCDVLVAGNPDNLVVADPERTVAVVSTADVPSGAMIREPETAFIDHGSLAEGIDARTRADRNTYIDVQQLSLDLFGSDQYANMMLVGVAYQSGVLPLSAASIERAIEINGVAVETNLQAFRRGRQSVCDPAGLDDVLAQLDPVNEQRKAPSATAVKLVDSTGVARDTELWHTIARFTDDLIDYQNVAYARRYVEVVTRAHTAERDATPGDDFTTAVAENLYRLMAYKDEYEVARLALDATERSRIAAAYGPKVKVTWKLHPPILRALGMKKKISLGPWFAPAYAALRAARKVRGTRLDVFGYTQMRRLERELVDQYIGVVDEIGAAICTDNHAVAVEIASAPDMVRGYEHVKLANVDEYHTRLASLRHRFFEGVAS
ncbi:indolepyruvate ferredoxin oxidoreductase family protein [Rhodococcus pyridinivorans]|uniref:indolepyruvate ferredoxin oxidoreductase family protein n=2 Tax=Nocardiaceae TaxID=85025 RepID=UPI0020C69ECD|nr:indolepyruvate ferredoxin oxidoreductase family protein [Rhodococcus pyridinivorans]UTM39604.1 indolepyruvate ferredoxin oxidoreductase family protein [Rhodococcus pyridinivorans]